MFELAGFWHGQHLAFDTGHNYPLPNLYVSMLQQLGIETDKFASSTGTMRGMEVGSAPLWDLVSNNPAVTGKVSGVGAGNSTRWRVRSPRMLLAQLLTTTFSYTRWKRREPPATQ